MYYLVIISILANIVGFIFLLPALINKFRRLIETERPKKKDEKTLQEAIDNIFDAARDHGRDLEAVRDRVRDEILARDYYWQHQERTQYREDTEKIDIFFGTDRKFEIDEGSIEEGKRLEQIQFSNLRNGSLTYGHAIVSIPKELHKVGIIERPRSVFFGIIWLRQSEDPRKHFVRDHIAIVKERTFADMLSNAAKKSILHKGHAFIFVHGYNVGFDPALFRTAQIAYDIGFDGVPILYSWPSGGALADYMYDLNSAEQSTPYLHQFIKVIQSVPDIERIHLIAHSMGSKALSLVLKELSFEGKEQNLYKIDELIFAAPDIDVDFLQQSKEQLKNFPEAAPFTALATMPRFRSPQK
jgi:esterase/lipase superfamily enzyme